MTGGERFSENQKDWTTSTHTEDSPFPLRPFSQGEMDNKGPT